MQVDAARARPGALPMLNPPRHLASSKAITTISGAHMPSQFVRFRVMPMAVGVLLVSMLFLGAGSGTAADAPAKSGATAVQTPPPASPPPPLPAAAAADSTAASADDSATADERDDPFPFGRHRGRIQIDDFDSFKQAMDVAPWIVGVVFLVLGSIFLTPIILLVGIIWYKLRKTRLQNEAVLKLAERGVMPSAQAVDAVMAGTPPAQAVPPAIAAAVPQAVATRRRAVWSDLRKGVLLVAVGLALVLYSITDAGEANWLGLVLLFVGAGYIALWWLEDRHLERRVSGGDGND
jgi:hypothetical protein